MTPAWVGLGANLGNANATLEAAMHDLAGLPRTVLRRRSSLYRTAPLDASGPDFINAVAALDTALDAQDLLAHLQTIEARHGRVRTYRNAPRTLDLDLLLFGGSVIATAELTVPHPRMAARAFVLAPLLEVSPDIVIPGMGPAASLLAGLGAQPIVRLGEPTS
ncbi:MAG: 2-amino-4-hydroxy-6-hydroxymethyldihydropteridine diphosphokinase [Burkholderiales bacterium]|nr:2-amino-4-hydroxy-6-hydroxymethyldihydropteridine diphosphokinase [Burkholderiales bacterium]